MRLATRGFRDKDTCFASGIRGAYRALGAGVIKGAIGFLKLYLKVLEEGLETTPRTLGTEGTDGTSRYAKSKAGNKKRKRGKKLLFL